MALMVFWWALLLCHKVDSRQTERFISHLQWKIAFYCPNQHQKQHILCNASKTSSTQSPTMFRFLNDFNWKSCQNVDCLCLPSTNYLINARRFTWLTEYYYIIVDCWHMAHKHGLRSDNKLYVENYLQWKPQSNSLECLFRSFGLLK